MQIKTLSKEKLDTFFEEIIFLNVMMSMYFKEKSIYIFTKGINLFLGNVFFMSSRKEVNLHQGRDFVSAFFD